MGKTLQQSKDKVNRNNIKKTPNSGIGKAVSLRESEQQISRIFETTDEGIILVDIGGDIVKANSAAIRILKLAPDKLHKQSLHLPYWEIPAQWTVLNPDGTLMPFHQNPLTKAIVDKQITKNAEFGIKFNDGSVTWLNSSTAPFISEQGRVEGIVFTFADITEKKRLRDEKEHFTKRLIDVQEEERNRVSRELHDDTAQWLSLLSLEIDDIIARGKQIPPEIIERLQRLRSNTDKALQEVRRFSHELRPTVLKQFGLTAALELIVGEFNSAACLIGTEAKLKISGDERRLPEEAELVLFRITQESLSNIRKHAGATKATVNLSQNTTSVTLTVTDNGKGFEAGEKPQPNSLREGGMGLIGMRERAHMIGGRFSVKSIPGEGTTISVKVPVKAQSSKSGFKDLKI